MKTNKNTTMNTATNIPALPTPAGILRGPSPAPKPIAVVGLFFDGLNWSWSKVADTRTAEGRELAKWWREARPKGLVGTAGWSGAEWGMISYDTGYSGRTID